MVLPALHAMRKRVSSTLTSTVTDTAVPKQASETENAPTVGQTCSTLYNVEQVLPSYKLWRLFGHSGTATVVA
jgi:hypothetical protein